MKLAWQRNVNNWLNKRIPAATRFSLNHKNIFIFPSRFGGLYLFLCLGLFILGTNYQNNLMILLCYFLVSLFILNLFIAYLNFSKLDIQLGKVHNGYVNDTVQLPIWINHSQTAASGLITMHFWQQKERVEFDLDNISNPIYLALPCKQRGKLTLPRITFNSYFPLGLFRCWTHLQFETHLLAYPAPLHCSISLYQQDDESSHEEAMLTQRGHDDFDSLAPYKQGEPLYHVAWKQVAKGQGMISKQFSHQSGATGWLKLSHMPSTDVEKNLSELCFQVIELTRKNSHFGLDLGIQKIAAGSGLEHQQSCLTALALYGSKPQGIG